MSWRLDIRVLGSVALAACIMLADVTLAVGEPAISVVIAADRIRQVDPASAGAGTVVGANVANRVAEVSTSVDPPATITEKSGGTVVLQYPSPNTAFSGADTSSILLQAAVGVVGEQILQVWFRYCEGTDVTCSGPVNLIKTMVAPPYEAAWVPPALTAISNTARTYSYLVWAQAQFTTSAPVTSAVVPITFFEPQLPQVSLDAPDGSLGFADPANVVLYARASAAATDPPSNVARVDFMDGDAAIGTMTTSNSPPSGYAFTWRHPALGRHMVTARVTDSRGYARVSNPLTIAVLQAAAVPAIVITSPSNGRIFSSGDTLDLAADVSAGGSTLVKVEFAMGSRVIATVSSPPYVAKWFNPPPGIHGLVARAYDDFEMRTASAPVFIEVHERARHPAVVMTAPAPGSVNAGPAMLAAEALSPDAVLTRVDFFAGATLLGSATAAPYRLEWTSPADGPVSLTAKAYDSTGDSTTSSRVTVTFLARAPRIVLTEPKDGTQFSSGAIVRLVADADEPGDTITKVELIVDDAVVDTSFAIPYGASLSSLSPGTHRATARATDSRGVATTSLPISFTISAPLNAPPLVSMSSPVQAQSYAAGAATNLVATAADPDGSIAHVEFFADGVLLGTVSRAPFTFIWNGGSVGDHTVYARATDNLGATSQSPAVSFSIRAAVLDVTLPAEGTSIPADFVLVSGTYGAPANSGVTVNGIVAQNDGEGRFFVNNVPLTMGENTLTVTLTTEDGQSFTASRKVTRVGTAPMKVTLDAASGSAPAALTLGIDNRSPYPVESVRFANLSGGVVDSTAFGQTVLGVITFTAPGIYTPEITVTDVVGNSYTQVMELLVHDPHQLELRAKALFSRFTGALARGDRALALSYFGPVARVTYTPVFDAIAPHLAEIVEQWTSPDAGYLSEELAELAVTRTSDGRSRLYLIYMLRDGTGVLRLDSM